MYTLILITIFAILSIKNIENEFIILAYSYLLVIEMKNIKQISNKLDNSVTIIALHLGYGGIEQYISSLTKMINKKIYIVSTYKLYDKPPFEYNASISYLMDYGPNTEEIKDALRSKNIIKVFKEGIRSLKILYLKKYDNIEKIEDINSEYIITTREIHNELVGYYGRSDIIKIATEHNYHNNNKKYIKRLVNSVNNMNYFVLVSKYLEEYYKDKVKINTIYIPNVLEKLPREKSTSFGHNLVSVGRLSKVKAQDELIELIAMLKEDYNDIKLTLIGDGEERSYLEDLIKSKNLTKNITNAIENKAKSAPLFTLCNTIPLIVSTKIIKITPTEYAIQLPSFCADLSARSFPLFSSCAFSNISSLFILFLLMHYCQVNFATLLYNVPSILVNIFMKNL